MSRHWRGPSRPLLGTHQGCPYERRAAKPPTTAWHGRPGHEPHGQDARATILRMGGTPLPQRASRPRDDARAAPASRAAHDSRSVNNLREAHDLRPVLDGRDPHSPASLIGGFIWEDETFLGGRDQGLPNYRTRAEAEGILAFAEGAD